MHNEIKGFFARMKLGNGLAFSAERVLECGSYDINGNPRGFFSSAKEYIGIDWRKGPCVDEVSLVHEYKSKPDGYFDFIIATSLIEHDPHWPESIQRMCQLLRIGGSLLITCGGPGFHEHEKETAPSREGSPTASNRPGGLPAGTYYQNRTVNDLVFEITQHSRFSSMIVEDDPTTKDIRVFATMKMPDLAGVPEGMSPSLGVSAQTVRPLC